MQLYAEMLGVSASYTQKTLTPTYNQRLSAHHVRRPELNDTFDKLCSLRVIQNSDVA